MKGQWGGNENLGETAAFVFLTSACSGQDVLGTRQFARSDVHRARYDLRRRDLRCLLRLNEA